MPCDADTPVVRRGSIAPRACSSDGPSRSIANQKASRRRPTPHRWSPTPSPAPTGVTEERLGVGKGNMIANAARTGDVSEHQKEDRCPVRTGVVDAAARRAHVTDALDGVNTSEVGDLWVIVDVQDDRGRRRPRPRRSPDLERAEVRDDRRPRAQSARVAGCHAHPEQPEVAEGHVAPYRHRMANVRFTITQPFDAPARTARDALIDWKAMKHGSPPPRSRSTPTATRRRSVWVHRHHGLRPAGSS